MAVSRNIIRRTVRNLIDDGVGVSRDGANLTEIAEAAAHELGHDEWLDDSEHDVWEIALEVADARGLVW